jgi:AraC-like DNA-binding protein
MEHAHPRPWHAGSIFTTGPHRPLSIGDRCLWLGKLSNALQARQVSGKEYLAGRAILSFMGEDGRLDPSHAAIAERACCSERTVRRALARLEALGLLRWQRRLVRQPGAWRAEQTSNAYEMVPDGRPITARAPAAQGSLRLHRGGQDGREDRSVRITEAPISLIPDPGRDLLAARRAVMEVQWRQAPAGGR